MNDYMKDTPNNWKRIAARLTDEEGSFLVKIAVLAVIVAVVALMITDGMAVYYCYRNTNSLTQDAAGAAELDWQQHKNDNTARDVAASYCQSHGLVFDDFQVLTQPEHGYQVTCSSDATTRVFYRLPWFKNRIHQVGTASAFDS